VVGLILAEPRYWLGLGLAVWVMDELGRGFEILAGPCDRFSPSSSPIQFNHSNSLSLNPDKPRSTRRATTGHQSSSGLSLTPSPLTLLSSIGQRVSAHNTTGPVLARPTLALSRMPGSVRTNITRSQLGSQLHKQSS